MSFLFEKLDAYNKAVIFADEIDSLLETQKSKLSASVRDQLSRASLSVSLNLAEFQRNRARLKFAVEF